MMRNKTLSIGLCIAAVALFFCPSVYSEDKGASYQALLSRLKAGDLSMDFRELRLAYTETNEYSPYGQVDERVRSEMFAALKDKKYQTALDLAGKILDKTYVDLESHHVCRMAYKGMNDQKRSAFHEQVFLKLARSIMSGGNGRTPETAGQVINTGEEYVILSLMGLTLKKQKLIREGGHSYDRMEARDDRTGEDAVLYFNVDVPVSWLNQRLKKP